MKRSRLERGSAVAWVLAVCVAVTLATTEMALHLGKWAMRFVCACGAPTEAAVFVCRIVQGALALFVASYVLGWFLEEELG